MSPQEGRETFDGFIDLFGEGPDLARVEDHTLPGDVNVRLYADDSDEPQPAVMYFHGGGWVLGNIQTHDALCRRIAKASGCTVISVDYGLAPENPFPKPLDDCYSATLAVADKASDIHIDSQRIAVAGDSAGGNLAAAVSLRARDHGGPAIKLQVLLYPVIEPGFETESYQQFAESHGLTKENMKWFWEQYLGAQPAGPLAAISRAETLEGLPAAHVVTAEYDVLRDEGEAFAGRLIALVCRWRSIDSPSRSGSVARKDRPTTSSKPSHDEQWCHSVISFSKSRPRKNFLSLITARDRAVACVGQART